MQRDSSTQPIHEADGHEFHSLNVLDANISGGGWRHYIIEVDGVYCSASFHPCDWLMHPRGKNMTVYSSNYSPKFDTGIREAVRLYNERAVQQ